MNAEIKKELFDALMISLSYIQDIEALEKAGVETAYKKGLVKRDLQAIKNAINTLEGSKVV